MRAHGEDILSLHHHIFRSASTFFEGRPLSHERTVRQLMDELDHLLSPRELEVHCENLGFDAALLGLNPAAED